jgi:Glyoxalase-like domain
MSALSLQITFDCAEPHALARFWAAVLGTEVEDHHDFIGTMLDAGHADPADVVVVDGRRAWAEAASCADPQGRYPRMLFMVVPEGKTAKNRMHLDLHLALHLTAGHADDAREAEVERVVGLGATRLYDGQLGPQHWVTMADPEGNEFCVG